MLIKLKDKILECDKKEVSTFIYINDLIFFFSNEIE